MQAGDLDLEIEDLGREYQGTTDIAAFGQMIEQTQFETAKLFLCFVDLLFE